MSQNTAETSIPIAPWGSPPTPLFPRVLREHWSTLPAPPTIEKLAGRPVELADLSTGFWTGIATPAPAEALLELSQVVSWRLRDVEGVVAVSSSASVVGVDLQKLPFRMRTINAIGRGGFVDDPASLRGKTIGALLTIRQFGVRSLLDLLCVLEAFDDFVAQRGEIPPPVRVWSHEETPSEPVVVHKLPIRDVENALSEVASWGQAELGLKSLGDVLHLSQGTVPPEVERAWRTLEALPLDLLADERVKKYSPSASLEHFLAELDERQLAILTERILSLDKGITLDALGKLFGDVSRERVRQLERRLRDQLEDPLVLGPVKRLALRVRDSIGWAFSTDSNHLPDVRRWVEQVFLGDNERDIAWSLLLHFAGPYRLIEGWLVAGEVVEEAKEELLHLANQDGVITSEAASKALSELLVAPEMHTAFLEKFLPVRHVDSGWIRWDGNALDKIERILRLRGKPATADTLLAETGEKRNVAGIRWRMIEDPRFARINRQNEFALPEWGFDEYTGIVDEIKQEIERCGGVADAEHLIDTISARYGVASASVNTYLNAPMFIRSGGGRVRLRREDDAGVPVRTDLATAPNCFLHGGRWTLRVAVDADALRGSGRGLPEAFAAYMGIAPGSKLDVPARASSIRVSWRTTSAFGPDIGSVRDELIHLGAVEGDLLFLRFTEEGSFDTWLTRQRDIKDSSPEMRLGLLIGYPGGAEIRDLASALGLDTAGSDQHKLRAEVERTLQARRDKELLALVSHAPADDDLDAVLRRLGDVLD